MRTADDGGAGLADEPVWPGWAGPDVPEAAPRPVPEPVPRAVPDEVPRAVPREIPRAVPGDPSTLVPARVPAPSPAFGPEPGPPGLDRTRPLRPGDLGLTWRLDFHHPRGVVPLGVELLDTMMTASQQAARELGMGTGITARLVGPHVYFGPASSGAAAPGGGQWLPGVQRGPALEAYRARFRSSWAVAAQRLDARLARLEAVGVTELAAAGRAGVAAYLARARAVHRLAWRLHFETMYRLLALHAQFLSTCAGLGIEPVTAAELLQGEDSAVAAADRALRELVRLAEAEGLAELFEQAAADELTGLPAGPLQGIPGGRRWAEALAGFLRRHGQRGVAGADLLGASWAEDPAPVLALVRRGLLDGEGSHGQADPAGLAATVRAGLPPARRSEFDTALAAAREANFAWWNEEHNAVIDLRAHLPVRRAALAAARATAGDDEQAVFYLRPDELDRLLAGRSGWRELAGPAAQRREYVQAWQSRRAELPPALGPAAAVADPVLREILGAGALHPSVAAGSGPALRLTGLGVSPGVARGPARVIRDPDGLAELRPGEVLVCEATSPGWTPVFERLAGCVCDQGGMLTHAAIISREYRLPCACAVDGASAGIRTGDLVEVDGALGVVTVLARAGQW